MQSHDRLPSFAEATANDKNDPSRLPSYREARRFRFHPYSRIIPVLVDEADRLLVRSPSFFLVFSDSTDIQNTVYDDERVVLDVPPPLPATLVVTVDSTTLSLRFSTKPTLYSVHFNPKLLTSLKSVSATIWNAPSRLNYVFNAFPQSLWFVFFSFSAPLFSLTIIRNLLRALRVRRVDKKPSGLDNVQNLTSTFHHDSHWCSSVLR